VRAGAESVKLVWSATWEILGARELMFIIQLYVDVKLSNFAELGSQTLQSGNFAPASRIRGFSLSIGSTRAFAEKMSTHSRLKLAPYQPVLLDRDGRLGFL
jgi:hypothetical protein